MREVTIEANSLRVGDVVAVPDFGHHEKWETVETVAQAYTANGSELRSGALFVVTFEQETEPLSGLKSYPQVYASCDAVRIQVER